MTQTESLSQDEIISMARQAGWQYAHGESEFEPLWAFAKLVAERTLMNIDPSSFMSFQEGVEVGVTKERNACIELIKCTKGQHMSEQIEALKLALEALDAITDDIDDTELSSKPSFDMALEAIDAIKKALANHIEDNLAMVAQPTPSKYAMGYAKGFEDGCKPKPEQEPVVWMNPSWIDPDTRGWPIDSFVSILIEGWLPLYTTTPQHKPLTNEQIGAILKDPNIAEKHQGKWLVFPYAYARAIEAAHGIKE